VQVQANVDDLEMLPPGNSSVRAKFMARSKQAAAQASEPTFAPAPASEQMDSGRSGVSGTSETSSIWGAFAAMLSPKSEQALRAEREMASGIEATTSASSDAPDLAASDRV
jgi:hypothetical protein